MTTNTTTTTLPDDPGAKVETSKYASGRPFYLAVCRDLCGAVLNSGHHFDTKADAQRWCNEHNTYNHVTYRRPANEPSEIGQMFWEQRPAWG